MKIKSLFSRLSLAIVPCLLFFLIFAQAPAISNNKRSLRVTMKDGTVYELSDYQLSYRQKPRTGFYTYHTYGDYKREYVPIHVESIIYHFPLAKISMIIPQSGEKRQNLNSACKVMLRDQREFVGALQDAKPGHSHHVLSMVGKIEVEGYPAEFTARMSTLSEIAFTKTISGKIEARVQHVDGAVTENVSEVKFVIDGEDSRGGADRIWKKFNLTMKNATLDIPVEDVIAMHFANKKWSLHLKNGKVLQGAMRDLYIFGKVDMEGDQAWFYGYTGTYDSGIESIEFVESPDKT